MISIPVDFSLHVLHWTQRGRSHAVHPSFSVDRFRLADIPAWLAYLYNRLLSAEHINPLIPISSNELSQHLVRYCSVEDATLEGAVCCR